MEELFGEDIVISMTEVRNFLCDEFTTPMVACALVRLCQGYFWDWGVGKVMIKGETEPGGSFIRQEAQGCFLLIGLPIGLLLVKWRQRPTSGLSLSSCGDRSESLFMYLLPLSTSA
jgi:hypothetical protein